MRVRADRLATLYFFHPLHRLARHGTKKIPVLMYHSISEPHNPSLHPYYETATAPQVFAEHIRFLHEHNYRTVSLPEAVSLLKSGARSAAKLVVITFDDGFEDFYRHAFPVLNSYGYQATVFLPTAFIGETPLKFKDLCCLTWNQVRELHAGGTIFGSHTVNHPKLKDLTPSQLHDEVRQSKLTIEDQLGCAVDSFACPYAFPAADRSFRRVLRRALEDAGYRNGVTTTVGRLAPQADVFFMKRLPVNSHDSLGFLRAKLEGGYDWTYAPQYLWKKLSSGPAKREQQTNTAIPA